MITPRIVSRTALWLTFLMFAATSARADTVVLTNGDRLTGEIQKLADGKLSLKTGYAGDVQIDWKVVDQLTTDGAVEVETHAGKRYRGTIRSSSEGFEITSADARKTVATPHVVGLSAVSEDGGPGFWERLEGNVDVGYNLTRGNSTLTQSSVGLGGEYRKPGYKVQASASSLFSRQNDAAATSRQSANLRYDKFLGPRLLAFAVGGLERNDRKRLNLRSNAGGGVGWRLQKTQNSELSVLGGLTYTNEQFQAHADGIAPGDSFGEGLLGLEWNTTPFDSVHFSTSVSLRPSLAGSGRYRIEYDSSVRIPLINRLAWSLSLFDRFDSDPPIAVQRNDYGLVSAFGFAF